MRFVLIAGGCCATVKRVLNKNMTLVKDGAVGFFLAENKKQNKINKTLCSQWPPAGLRSVPKPFDDVLLPGVLGIFGYGGFASLRNLKNSFGVVEKPTSTYIGQVVHG